MLAFLIVLAIVSSLIIMGMKVSVRLYTSGALGVKPLRLLRHMEPAVA
jgi:hypothetical protein